MVYFVIGAVIGVIQFAINLIRMPTSMNYPFQAFAVSAVYGTAVYGTIIWAVATFVFGY